MTFPQSSERAFSLLELLLAMALFTMAAVSLAEAISVISLTVSESVDDAVMRERLRSELLLVARSPIREQGTRTTEPDETGLAFRIDIERASLENREGVSLNDLYKVTLTAIQKEQGGGQETLDSISTLVNPAIFSSQ